MRRITFMPPAKKYLKKLKNKELKRLYDEAIKEIRNNPEVGNPKKGDLAGIMGYDIQYNKNNYEIAYRVAEKENEEIIVIIMAGTRENFWQAVKRYIS